MGRLGNVMMMSAPLGAVRAACSQHSGPVIVASRAEEEGHSSSDIRPKQTDDPTRRTMDGVKRRRLPGSDPGGEPQVD